MSSSASIAIVGAGPAGLMAAQVLLQAGCRVDVYDAMPSAGRKFLMAGRGGLNLTHSEPAQPFLARYGDRQAQVGRWLSHFDADALRAWAHDLGVQTFVGTSGRVFPAEMKAAPLLRAWLQRLRAQGLRLHMRHRWEGWDADGGLRFATPEGQRSLRADAVVLALGGASWPKLGSDGAWQAWLAARDAAVAPLVPANCGFDCGWSAHFAERHAGQPLKPIAMAPADAQGRTTGPMRRGECMATATGLEGGLVYAWSAPLRDAIARDGQAWLCIDLLPDHSLDAVRTQVAWPRGARSMSSHLRSRLGLHGVKTGLLRECLDAAVFQDADLLAQRIKCLPVRLQATRPIDEAISSAGGVAFSALDDNQMLQAAPGVFCAGEMIDWEAPTGGYLLTACFASGHAAGQGVLRWLHP